MDTRTLLFSSTDLRRRDHSVHHDWIAHLLYTLALRSASHRRLSYLRTTAASPRATT